MSVRDLKRLERVSDLRCSSWTHGDVLDDDEDDDGETSHEAGCVG